MEHVIANLLQDFERGKMNRRQLIRSLSVAAAAAAAASLGPVVAQPAFAFAGGKKPKAIGVNHISIQAPDYQKQSEFYSSLLGLPIQVDKPDKSNLIQVGETTLIFQNLGVREKAIPGVKPEHGSDDPGVDHISYTIADWDSGGDEAMAAELKSRGLSDAANQRKDRSSTFHVKDPIGLGVQLGGKNQL